MSKSIYFYNKLYLIFRNDVQKIKEMELRLSTNTSKGTPQTSSKIVKIPEDEVLMAIANVFKTEPQTVPEDPIEIKDMGEEAAAMTDEGTASIVDQKPCTSAPKKGGKSLRGQLVANMSSSDEDTPIVEPPKKKKKTEKKKRVSTMELARQNQLAYKRFMETKIPKILKAIGIESDSSADDSD